MSGTSQSDAEAILSLIGNDQVTQMLGRVDSALASTANAAKTLGDAGARASQQQIAGSRDSAAAWADLTRSIDRSAKGLGLGRAEVAGFLDELEAIGVQAGVVKSADQQWTELGRTIEATAKELGLTDEQLLSVHRRFEALRDAANDAGDEGRRAARSVGDAWNDLGDELDAIKRRVGLIAAAEIGQAVSSAVSSAMDALRDGAQARAASAAFARVFADAEGALHSLQSATRGMVADADLQALALQAQRSGIAAGDMARLFEVATRAALGTGQATEDVVAQLLELSIGTADEVEEGLKRLGLVVDTTAAQDRYAASIGKTADALTRQEQAQASLRTVTTEVGKAFDGAMGDKAVERVARFDAGIKNLGANLKGLAVDAFDFVARMVEVDGLDEWVAYTQRSTAALRGVVDAVASLGLSQERQLALTTRILRFSIAGQEAFAERVRAGVEAQKAAEAATKAAGDAEAKRLALLREEVFAITATQAAEIDHAKALALTAEQLGNTQAAAEKWAQVVGLLGRAGIAAADDVTVLYAAVRAGNSEMARAIELQAELAAAAGDAAAADALRAQAAGLVEGDTGARPSAPRGGGGGGARRAAAVDDTDADFKARLAAVRDTALEWQRDLAAEQERARADAVQREIDATYEQVRAVAEAQADAKRQEVESIAAGFDGLAASVLGLRDAFGEIDGLNVDGLANAVGGLDDLVLRFRAVADAADEGRAAMAAGALGAVAASGKMVAGIVKDQRAQAVIMALVEQAEAWGSFAVGDYVGFGAHMASSALWGVVAGKGGGGGGGAGGGGGGGGRGSRESPRLPASQSAPQEAPVAPITVHVSGTFFGTGETTVGRDIGKVLAAETARSVRTDFRGGAPQ